MVKPRQGDIFWVRFGHLGDSGPSGKRPAVVIQNDLLNGSNINTTVVSLITSSLKLEKVPWNVKLNKGMGNIPKSSVVAVSQVATIDKSRLLEKIGSLDAVTTDKILDGCRRVIGRNIF
jgi:mRNA interferase MazF